MVFGPIHEDEKEDEEEDNVGEYNEKAKGEIEDGPDTLLVFTFL